MANDSLENVQPAGTRIDNSHLLESTADSPRAHHTSTPQRTSIGDAARHMLDGFEVFDRDHNGFLGYFELGDAKNDSRNSQLVRDEAAFLQEQSKGLSMYERNDDPNDWVSQGISRRDLAGLNQDAQRSERTAEIRNLLSNRPELFGDTANHLDVTRRDVTRALRTANLNPHERSLLSELHRRFDHFSAPHTDVDVPYVGSVTVPLGDRSIREEDLRRTPTDEPARLWRAINEMRQGQVR